MLKPNTKAEATKRARALKKMMKSKGWKIRVWHNLFWCYAISKPYVGIHECPWENGIITYTVYFNTDPDGGGGGCAWWHNRKDYTDPNKAMAAQRKSAKRFIKTCQDALDAIS